PSPVSVPDAVTVMITTPAPFADSPNRNRVEDPGGRSALAGFGGPRGLTFPWLTSSTGVTLVAGNPPVFVTVTRMASDAPTTVVYANGVTDTDSAAGIASVAPT